MCENQNRWVAIYFYIDVMQGAMNQMGPPMQQGHFMGMNPMHSGPGGAPPGSMLNMQGPSSTSGNQMYPTGGAFNRPQGAQMPPMPGLGPYQVIAFLFYCMAYREEYK